MRVELVKLGEHVAEVGAGPRPISGVPTGTAAFLGETERGSLRPTLVTSLAEFRRWFGDVFGGDRHLPAAAAGFFENGGERLYVCRIAGAGATAASRTFGDLEIRASGPGAWGTRVWVRILQGSSVYEGGRRGFRLRLAYWSSVPRGFQPFDPFDAANAARLPRPQHVEEHDDLSVDPASPNHFRKRLVELATGQPSSVLVTLATHVAAPALPAPTAPEGAFLDQQGGSEAPAAPGPADFTGEPGRGRDEPSGLRALELGVFDDVALVYAPYPPGDAAGVQRALIDHCEKARHRFAILDGPRDAELAGLDPRAAHGWDTARAAFYAPWISVVDDCVRRDVPPGGHVAGVYARSDRERGVFKAPSNEVVRGAVGVRSPVSDTTHAALGARSVNVIRSFTGRDLRVWGARTLSSDPQWQYVNVRRLVSFVERSILEGTQWVVFEPNAEPLWARVAEATREFLRQLWRAGALAGRTEADAFYVTCDRTTMTDDDVQNGRLICVAGIAPAKPGEFVVVRVMQQTAETRS